MHNLCFKRRRMWCQPSVIYLLIVVQSAVWSGRGEAFPNEANDMYRDLLVQYGAPEIVDFEPDFELDAGSDFELSCKGSKAITWIIHRSVEEKIEPEQVTDSKLTVESYVTGDDMKSHGSRVTIIGASAEVVGRYYCVYVEAENTVEDIADLEPEFKAISTYIFVKDPHTPLVPVTYPVILGVQYSEVIIPCKPTARDGQVILVKDESQMEVNHHAYDNTHGFTIMAYRVDQGGMYQCRSATNQSTESPQDQVLHFEVQIHEASATEYVRRPYNDPSKYQLHVTPGDPIRIKCKVDAQQGVRYNMQWRLPNKAIADNDSRITVSSISQELHTVEQNYNVGTLELVIAQSKMSDHGVYNCTVRDHNNYENYRLTQVIMVPKDAAFINLTEENNLDKIIHSSKSKPIRIVFNYKAHPPAMFYWTKNNDPEALHVGEKYNTSVDDTRVNLIIYSADIDDTGIYTLHAENEGQKVNISMPVYVKSKPILRMDTVYAKPQQRVNFKCTCLAYPKPENLRFSFVPCPEPWTNCSKPMRKTDMTEYGHRLTDVHNTEYTIVEEYSFQADHAGYVGCYAVNEVGQAIVKADLLISDLEEPVTIKRVAPTTDVTIGDRVEIVCAASVYNHTDQIEFFHNRTPIDVSEGISFESKYETYAYRRKMVIDDVQKDNEGEIFCQASTPLTNTVDSEVINLVVAEPEEPTIEGSAEQQKLRFNTGELSRFQCIVGGMPRPTIEWYKDGNPIISIDNNKLAQPTDDTIIISYLMEEDSGVYTCKAQNKMGSVEKKWTLTVTTVTVRKEIVYLVVSLVIALIVAVILVTLFYYKKRKEVVAMKEAGLANFEEGNLEQMNPEISLDEQADLLPYKTEYEFPKEKLKLGKQLGAGAFGVVMKATASGIMVNEDETTVAVKMVKKQTDNEVMRALISELKIMVHLGQHLNVVNLLGAVTKNIAKRELMVIVEYCRFGNVQNFLLRHRPYFIDQINTDTGEIDSTIDKNQLRWSKAGYTYNSSNSGDYSKGHMNSKGYVRHSGVQNMGMIDSCNTEGTVLTTVDGEEMNSANTVSSAQPLWRSNYGMDYKGPARSVTTTDLVCWASQVACGMEYLASRKVLHGDLAARNILLCDDNVVKICDFGLARSMYKTDNYKKKGEAPLPFKWLALECISDNVFGTYSDVWAYGIVLWELFSLAKIPYPGMEANQELYNKLRDGYRMDKPQYANQDIYDIMLNCWNVKPDSRPTFKDLKSRFNAMLPEELRNHYIDLNEPYLAMNTEKEQRGEPDYLASLGPPEEPAPPAPPTYVNGIILPLPPISDNPDYLKMTNGKSDSEESQFDFAAFSNSQPSPTLKNNLDSSPQQGSKRHKKKGIPEEIPMLRNNGTSFNSDSETEATSPVPMIRTTKMTQPEPEYTNLKRMAPAPPKPTKENDAFSNPGYVVVNTVNEKRLK